MADIIIGMIGFGTVGTGVAKILLNDRAMLEQRAGCAVELRRIVDLDVTTDRGVKLPSGMLTANINDILADASINTVIEVIGGENPARKFIEARARSREERRHLEQRGDRQARKALYRDRESE